MSPSRSCPPEQVSRKAAAEYAVENFVKSGMIVGLGTGSTAAWVIDHLGQKVATNLLKGVVCVCTSVDTEMKAGKAGLEIVEVDDLHDREIDVAIDGADEIDPRGNIIKGKGAALYREKFVESMAKQLVIVADEQKRVSILGADYLPVEIEKWNSKTVCNRIQQVCEKLEGTCSVEIRRMKLGDPLITDNGNYIAMVTFYNGLRRPLMVDRALKQVTGVTETGLFCAETMHPVVVLADNSNGDAWEFKYAPL